MYSFLVFATWIILGSGIFLLGEYLLGFYTTDPPGYCSLGMVRLKVIPVAYFTCGTMNVFPGLTMRNGLFHFANVIYVNWCLFNAYRLVSYCF